MNYVWIFNADLKRYVRVDEVFDSVSSARHFILWWQFYGLPQYDSAIVLSY